MNQPKHGKVSVLRNRSQTKKLLILPFGLFIGCLGSPPSSPKPVYFEHQEQAGSVQVGIQSVAPFEEYVDSLQPRFELTEKQAFETAITQTRIEELREIRALLTKIAVSLPSTTKTVEEVLKRTDDKQESSRTEITNEGPASTAPTAAAPTASATLGGVPAAPTGTVGIDAALRYRAAAALFQDVALLSSYVREAAVSTDSTPYIVRLLVTVLPSARTAPYDAYSSVSFFLDAEGEPTPYLAGITQPDFWVEEVKTQRSLECDGREVQVIPLFVTDNLESTSNSSAQEAVRGTEASAGGVVSNFGLGAGLTATTDTSLTSRGLNLTGIQTIAVTSRNTVQLRLGAAAENGVFRAVPRTYNLTILVLVPSKRLPVLQRRSEEGQRELETRDAYEQGPEEVVLACDGLRFFAHSSFREVEKGAPLPIRSKKDLKNALDSLLRTELAINRNINLSSVLEAAEWADYDTFVSSLKQAAPAASREGPHIWPRVVSLVNSRGKSRGRIPLPQSNFRFFYDPRTTDPKTPILDDGKSARAYLYGAERLEEKGIHGGLSFDFDGTRIQIESSKVEITPDRRGAIVTFPSIKAFLATVASTPAPAFPKTGTLYVQYAPTLQRWSPKNQPQWAWEQDGCPIIVTKEEEKPKPEPGFLLRSTTSFIRAKNDGTGEIAIEIKKSGKDNRQVLFNVSGAILAAVIPEAPYVGAYHAGETDHTYALSLKGLMVGSTVTVHSWRMEGSEAVRAPDISLLVTAAESSPSATGPKSSGGGH